MACAAAGCGGSSPEDEAPPEASGEPAAELQPTAPEPREPADPPEAADPPAATGAEIPPPPGEAPAQAGGDDSTAAGDPTRCSAPAGVSAAPRSIEELVALLDALPKPTTVVCLVQSLARPVEIYATRSELSAQPAAGERNPRTFIVLEPLLLSVVPDGASSSLVEVGYRTSADRSIKAEIVFPLTRPVTASDLITRVQTGRVSMCSGCHLDERRVDDGFFAGTDGAFESGVIPPLNVYRIDVEAYRDEATACDAAVEPERCAMLTALFGHGEVRASALWASEDAEP